MSADDHIVNGELLDYFESLREAGMYVGTSVVSVARMFFQRIGLDGWSSMSLDEQCDIEPKYRRVVGWLMATVRVQATPAYLVRVPAYLGGISSRLHPEMFATFESCGADLGFGPKRIV